MVTSFKKRRQLRTEENERLLQESTPYEDMDEGGNISLKKPNISITLWSRNPTLCHDLHVSTTLFLNLGNSNQGVNSRIIDLIC